MNSNRMGNNIRPTIHDVARIAGVSTASVSRTLAGRGNVSDAVKDRVRQAVDQLGYKPHIVARSLVEQRTWLLGIIVPDISNPFFPELVKAIQVRAEKAGYGTLLSQVIGDTSFPHQLELLGAGRVDGIITVGLSVGQLASSEAVENMPSVPRSVALVSLDRDSALPGSTLIAVDHESSAKMAVSHLVEYGHRDILYIDGPDGLDLSVLRRRGYEEVMRSVKGRLNEEMVLQGDLSEASGYRAICQALAKAVHFTAVFAVNDLMAIGAMSALRNAGLVVPDDVSVVGFDDIKIAAYVSPGLTTVHQPVDLMGTVAVEVAIAEMTRTRRDRAGGVNKEILADERKIGAPDSTMREEESLSGDSEPAALRPFESVCGDGQSAGSSSTQSGDDGAGDQLQNALRKGLARESWFNGRRVITFDGSLVVRGSTTTVNPRRTLSEKGASLASDAAELASQEVVDWQDQPYPQRGQTTLYEGGEH